MPPLTRRQLLRRTAAGSGVLALAGCTNPNVPGLADSESVSKPFTNDAYTASDTTAGRWLQEGHDGGRRNAASTI
ncbi:twin-arginine translocation signal domain-containing protein [Halolamina pelagica]|uniref:twin-arginine translocation signal domain-containing protein n=1 Tax=Halolamina pelagica TaxID=699431 RepID=UPI0011876459